MACAAPPANSLIHVGMGHLCHGLLDLGVRGGQRRTCHLLQVGHTPHTDGQLPHHLEQGHPFPVTDPVASVTVGWISGNAQTC